MVLENKANLRMTSNMKNNNNKNISLYFHATAIESVNN